MSSSVDISDDDTEREDEKSDGGVLVLMITCVYACIHRKDCYCGDRKEK